MLAISLHQGLYNYCMHRAHFLGTPDPSMAAETPVGEKKAVVVEDFEVQMNDKTSVKEKSQVQVDVETVVVEDSQVQMQEPDNQEGLTQVDPALVPTGSQPEALASLPGQPETSPAPEPEACQPAALASSGQPENVGNSNEKAQDVDGCQEAQAQALAVAAPNNEVALVRSNAFLEESTLVDEEPVLTCKKCKLELALEDAVVRGPREMWCKECNCLYTMLRRHQSWPPPAFAELSLEQQCAFFANCRKEKEVSKAGNFSYKTVRNQLLSTLKEETIRQRKVQVGGTYLPLSVYAKRGYEVDAGFVDRNPRMWSPGLGDYVYLLAETSVDEAEIHNSVEAKILQAERNVKKRKAVALTDDEEKKSVAATSMAVDDMDLDTESGSEDQEEAEEGKKLTPKQIEKKLKKSATKAEKDAKRDKKKEEG